MILPTKSYKLSKSLIGIGSVILNHINDYNSIDELYAYIHEEYEYSYKEFTLAIVMLYFLSIIQETDQYISIRNNYDH